MSLNDILDMPGPPPSAAAISNAIRAVSALAEAIRSVPEIPSGHLYAQVCGYMDLDGYVRALDVLKRAGVVEQEGHLLRWIGPRLEP